MTTDEITRSIDEAWAEAEAALPAEYRIRTLTRYPVANQTYDEQWEAVAARPRDQHIRVGHGRTPAAALDNLWMTR